MSTKSLDRSITLVSILGILVSTYALYVEMSAEARPGYRALCDISEHASCSKVLTSKYAKGLGLIDKDSLLIVPNCVYGIIFYCIIIYLATFENVTLVRLQMLFSLTSVATCFYLAYLLAFVLHDFCVVCVSTYVINATLAALIYKKLNLLAAKNK